MRCPARIGRYEIRSQLGSGGAAEVLLGVATRPDGTVEEVAIKRPLPERADDPLAADVARAEAKLLSCIRHRNVVHMIELIDGIPPSLVLERLQGRTLAEIATKLPFELALALAAKAAAGLAAIHAAVDTDGVPLEAVHRDISPDNVFVTTDGIIKLFDFNVAFSRGHTSAPAAGALQGRIGYMSPEQARSETVDGRADVFSLAALTWELVAGERLFWRGNTLATLRALIDESIPRLGDRRVDVPSALDALLAEALSRTIADRPSAVVFEQRLRQLLPIADEPARHADLAALAR